MTSYAPWNLLPVHYHNTDASLLVGGTLTYFISGSTTLATVYADHTGAIGKNPVVLNGRGEPPTEGVYLDTSVIYKIVLADAGGVPIKTIDGYVPEGGEGTVGPPGPQGNNGALWYNGTSYPSSSIGVIGDYYINTSNGNVYQKTTSTAWTYELNIIGPEGSFSDQYRIGLSNENGITPHSTPWNPVYSGAGQDVTAGVGTSYSSATGRFTAQVAGDYIVSWNYNCTLISGSGSYTLNASIYNAGGGFARSLANSSSNTGSTAGMTLTADLSAYVTLSIGQYIQLTVTPVNTIVPTLSNLSIYRVGVGAIGPIGPIGPSVTLTSPNATISIGGTPSNPFIDVADPLHITTIKAPVSAGLALGSNNATQLSIDAAASALTSTIPLVVSGGSTASDGFAIKAVVNSASTGGLEVIDGTGYFSNDAISYSQSGTKMFSVSSSGAVKSINSVTAPDVIIQNTSHAITGEIHGSGSSVILDADGSMGTGTTWKFYGPATFSDSITVGTTSNPGQLVLAGQNPGNDITALSGRYLQMGANGGLLSFPTSGAPQLSGNTGAGLGLGGNAQIQISCTGAGAVQITSNSGQATTIGAGATAGVISLGASSIANSIVTSSTAITTGLPIVDSSDPSTIYQPWINVKAYTTANVTQSGTQTIDTVVLSVGDAVLCNGETSNVNNGVWIVQTGAWTRHPHHSTWQQWIQTIIYVTSGSAYAGTTYCCPATGTGTVGTNGTNWAPAPWLYNSILYAKLQYSSVGGFLGHSGTSNSALAMISSSTQYHVPIIGASSALAFGYLTGMSFGTTPVIQATSGITLALGSNGASQLTFNSTGTTITSTAELILPASTTSIASLNIPSTGSAPTSPAYGDIWVTNTGPYIKIAANNVIPTFTAGSVNQAFALGRDVVPWMLTTSSGSTVAYWANIAVITLSATPYGTLGFDVSITNNGANVATGRVSIAYAGTQATPTISAINYISYTGVSTYATHFAVTNVTSSGVINVWFQCIATGDVLGVSPNKFISGSSDTILWANPANNPAAYSTQTLSGSNFVTTSTQRYWTAADHNNTFVSASGVANTWGSNGTTLITGSAAGGVTITSAASASLALGAGGTAGIVSLASGATANSLVITSASSTFTTPIVAPSIIAPSGTALTIGGNNSTQITCSSAGAVTIATTAAQALTMGITTTAPNAFVVSTAGAISMLAPSGQGLNIGVGGTTGVITVASGSIAGAIAVTSTTATVNVPIYATKFYTPNNGAMLDNSTYFGIWGQALTPDTTNYSFLTSRTGSFTNLNTVSGGTQSFRIANTEVLGLSSTAATFSVPVVGPVSSQGAAPTAWNCGTSEYLYMTAKATAAVSIALTGMLAGTTNTFIFYQAASAAQTLTFTASGVTFNQTNTTNINTGTGSLTVTASTISSVYQYYTIKLDWVTTTLCFLHID